MAGRGYYLLSVLAVISTGALAQDAGADSTASAAPAPELRALADSCAAHKFETTVVAEGNRGKKVKICGKPEQSDAEWLVTLRDSARKVEADENMSLVVKEQILAALNAEIKRLETGAAAPVVPAPVAGISLPNGSSIVPQAQTVAAISFPQGPVTVPEAAPEYSRVPPLPAPKPRAVGAQAAEALAAPVERPRLTIRCALPNESFAACARLERVTQLMILADEDIAGGTSLRFLRGSNARAELNLGPLKKGDLLREKLPARVCAGVLRGKVQFQILSKSQVAETLGPFNLYCGS